MKIKKSKFIILSFILCNLIENNPPPESSDFPIKLLYFSSFWTRNSWFLWFLPLFRLKVWPTFCVATLYKRHAQASTFWWIFTIHNNFKNSCMIDQVLTPTLRSFEMTHIYCGHFIIVTILPSPQVSTSARFYCSDYITALVSMSAWNIFAYLIH